MFPKFAKRLSGLVLGCAFSAGTALGQTTGYVNQVPLAAPPVAAPDAGPVSMPMTVPGAAPINGAPINGTPMAPMNSAPCVDDAYTPRTLAPGCGRRPGFQDDCAPGVWVNVDYLLTWIKEAPSPGIIGIKIPVLPPGSPTVLGNQPINNNAFNGVRLQAGTWIDEARTVGYEASVFTHEHRSYSEGISSGPASFVVRPFRDTEGFGPVALPNVRVDAIPFFRAGGVTFSTDTRFTGWDFNVDFNRFDNGTWRGDILVGVRGMYLNESINIWDTTDAIAPLPNVGPLAGFDQLAVGQRAGAADRFNIHNNFIGGQLGGRLAYTSPRWLVTTTFKVAAGDTQQLLLVSGQSISTDPGVNAGGGFLANNGNFGRYYTHHFAVIPELGLNVAWRFNQYMSLRAGYNVLYWSNVSRATQNLPASINSSLSPASANFGNDPRPFQVRPTIETTDFWAQGLNLGVEFRF